MQARSEVGDAYLVARAREGYLDAYEMLVQRHSAMAYRVALRLCGNHHDAQDLAQEALIAAWQNLGRFRADSSFSTWLYQIVTRRTLNKVTRGRAADSLDLLGDLPGHGTRARSAGRAQSRRRRGHRRSGNAAVRPACRDCIASLRGALLRRRSRGDPQQRPGGA